MKAESVYNSPGYTKQFKLTAKEHEKMLKELKPGDEVMTSGGILGRVRSLSDDFISVDVGSTQLKVLKANVSRYVKSNIQPASAKTVKKT